MLKTKSEETTTDLREDLEQKRVFTTRSLSVQYGTSLTRVTKFHKNNEDEGQKQEIISPQIEFRVGKNTYGVF